MLSNALESIGIYGATMYQRKYDDLFDSQWIEASRDGAERFIESNFEDALHAFGVLDSGKELTCDGVTYRKIEAIKRAES